MILSAELIGAVLAATNDGVVVAQYGGTHCPVVYCNATFHRLTDYTPDDILGQDLIYPPLTVLEPEAWQTAQQALQSGLECNLKLRTPTRNGRHFWNQLRLTYLTSTQGISHAIAIHTDISQQEYVKNVLDKVSLLYREMSKRLEFTNETDHLTQLKNRSHLSTRGEFILSAAKREKLRLHALRIELTSFKLLNTLGGLALGEQCLVQVADMIKRYFSRATDIAIRMSDGEFVILCIEDDDSRVWERAEMLHREANALQIADTSARQHGVTLNIGIYSTTPSKHTTIEELIQNATQLVLQSHGNPSIYPGQLLIPH